MSLYSGIFMLAPLDGSAATIATGDILEAAHVTKRTFLADRDWLAEQGWLSYDEVPGKPTSYVIHSVIRRPGSDLTRFPNAPGQEDTRFPNAPGQEDTRFPNAPGGGSHLHRVVVPICTGSDALSLLTTREVEREIDTSRVRAKRASKDDGYDADFGEVWKHYPRKLGKQAARAAYVARRRAGVSHADLLRATEVYGQSRVGEDEKFTLHGATFFGAKDRWKDYLDGETSEDLALRHTIWETWDAEGFWFDADDTVHTELPSEAGILRPKDDKGRLVDRDGNFYAVSADHASGRYRISG